MRELDEAVTRVAVANARRYLAEGSSPTEAAALATPGAWAEFRGTVLRRLLETTLHEPVQPAAERRR